jgi:luciferase family oxidoreductase group 1
MLPHYSPYKVAESFSILCGLYPERVDLGVGRAPGSDPETAFALQRDRRQLAPDDFPAQLTELLAYLEDGFPAGHGLARLAALPGGAERPDVWLLGSSPQSAAWAAELGLPYAFADFINPHGAEIARRYQERFRPSSRCVAPRTVVAVSAICAETDEAAERVAASARMAFTLFLQGRLIPVPPVEKALTFLEKTDAGAMVGRARRLIVGAPQTVRRGLEQVAVDYGADELLIVTITHEHADRLRSYELVAGAFDLARSRARDGEGGRAQERSRC